MFPGDHDPETVAVATTLRGEFEQWVVDAEEVLEGARQVEATGRTIPRTQELADLIGRRGRCSRSA